MAPHHVCCAVCAVPWLHCNADTLLPILTVREMLLYTAELKRPLSEKLSHKAVAVRRSGVS